MELRNSPCQYLNYLKCLPNTKSFLNNSSNHQKFPVLFGLKAASDLFIY